MKEPSQAGEIDSTSGKLNKDQFVDRCTTIADSWTTADQKALAQFILGTYTGRKLIGTLQMLAAAQTQHAVKIDIRSATALQELARIQGLAAGMACAIDHILDYTQEEPANV